MGQSTWAIQLGAKHTTAKQIVSAPTEMTFKTEDVGNDSEMPSEMISNETMDTRVVHPSMSTIANSKALDVPSSNGFSVHNGHLSPAPTPIGDASYGNHVENETDDEMPDEMEIVYDVEMDNQAENKTNDEGEDPDEVLQNIDVNEKE